MLINDGNCGYSSTNVLDRSLIVYNMSSSLPPPPIPPNLVFLYHIQGGAGGKTVSLGFDQEREGKALLPLFTNYVTGGSKNKKIIKKTKQKKNKSKCGRMMGCDWYESYPPHPISCLADLMRRSPTYS